MNPDFTWFFEKYVKGGTEELPFSKEGAFVWIRKSEYTPEEGLKSLEKLKYLREKYWRELPD